VCGEGRSRVEEDDGRLKGEAMMRGTNETATFLTRLYPTVPSCGLDIMHRQISNKLEGQAVDGMDIPGARSTLLCVVMATLMPR
jgi:hypothetical protein